MSYIWTVRVVLFHSRFIVIDSSATLIYCILSISINLLLVTKRVLLAASRHVILLGCYARTSSRPIIRLPTNSFSQCSQWHALS